MTSVVEPYAVFAQKGVGGAVPGAALLVTWNGTAWSATKADIDAARARGYRVVWAGSATPTASDGLANGDMKDGVVVEGIVPVQDLTVTYTGSGWDKTPSEVLSARSSGGLITWQSSSVLPTASVGAADGDTYIGAVTSGLTVKLTTPMSIGSSQVPVAVDGSGTSDTITLTRLKGVKWAISGTTYDYASFAGATKTVDVGTGVPTVVTAVCEPGYEFISGATSEWTMNLTNTVPDVGVLTSSSFANYSNGTTFADNVDVTMNNAYGGTQTLAKAKYCNVTDGRLVVQNAGSFFSYDIPNLPTTSTVEFTYISSGSAGDVFVFPAYHSASGNGTGLRVLSGGTVGAAKNSAWTMAAQSYFSGAGFTAVSGDVIKATWDNSTRRVTVFQNGTERFVANAGNAQTATSKCSFLANASTNGSSLTIDDVKHTIG